MFTFETKTQAQLTFIEDICVKLLVFVFPFFFFKRQKIHLHLKKIGTHNSPWYKYIASPYCMPMRACQA